MGNSCGSAETDFRDDVDSLEVLALEYSLTIIKLRRLVALCRIIGVSQHMLDRLHASFNTMDLDESGTLSRDEFIESVLATEPSNFSVRAFGVFDANHDRRIDFLEFVHGVVYLCSCNKSNLARFAFRLVDVDNSGKLSVDEVQNVVAIIYGDTLSDYNKIARRHETAMETGVKSTPLVYHCLDANKDGLLSAEEWVKVAFKYPQLIAPAFHLQLRLRKKIINEHFWSRNSDRIREKCENLEEQRAHGWWDYHSKFGFEEERRHREDEIAHNKAEKKKKRKKKNATAVAPQSEEGSDPSPATAPDRHASIEREVRIGKNGKEYVVGSDLVHKK